MPGMQVQTPPWFEQFVLRNALPNLVHDQFAQKSPLPKNHGRRARFRRLHNLPLAMTPLTEGVTPDGMNAQWEDLFIDVLQYGNFIAHSDVIDLTAIDSATVWHGKRLGEQAGKTLDALIRDEVNTGVNVQYAGGKASRSALTALDMVTVDDVRKAVRTLERNNAPQIKGYYIGIIHPDIKYDIMSDPKWVAPKNYVDTKDIYQGEIGELYGVRFVQSTQAKQFFVGPLATGLNTLQVVRTDGAHNITVYEAVSASQATEIETLGAIVVNGFKYTVDSVTPSDYSTPNYTMAVITVEETLSPMVMRYQTITSAGASSDGRAVYSTLIFGQDAYGSVELAGGTLQNIIKGLGSAGTADPLNQRATVGWKAWEGSGILQDEFIVRLESCASFGSYKAA